jgi:hypothetical protein
VKLVVTAKGLNGESIPELRHGEKQMSSVACRRPAARATVPTLPRKVATLSLEAVVQSVELLSDLEALVAEGMLIEFVDADNTTRFCPQRKELQ